VKVPTRKPKQAFTLIEMLLVVAIISLLISMLLPALKLGGARRSVCQSNLKSLLQGYRSYASSNNGLIVGSDTGKNAWDWLRPNNNPSSITGGALYQYIGAMGSYVCPDQVYPKYLNSYSVNGMLNGEQKWTSRTNGTINTESTKGADDVTKTRITGDIMADKQMVFMEEDDGRGYNINSFMLGGSAGSFVDWVAANHSGGDHIGFLDGHVEHWEWISPVLRVRPKPLPAAGNIGAVQDWNRLSPIFRAWPNGAKAP